MTIIKLCIAGALLFTSLLNAHEVSKLHTQLQVSVEREAARQVEKILKDLDKATQNAHNCVYFSLPISASVLADVLLKKLTSLGLEGFKIRAYGSFDEYEACIDYRQKNEGIMRPFWR